MMIYLKFMLPLWLNKQISDKEYRFAVQQIERLYQLGERNFAGLDLRERVFSWLDLPKINLSGANLEYSILEGANLVGANLSYTDLTRADLTTTDLYQANLQHANLKDADLRGAELAYANLYGANLKGAELAGADLSQAIMPNGKVMPESTIFTRAQNKLHRFITE